MLLNSITDHNFVVSLNLFLFYIFAFYFLLINCFNIILLFLGNIKSYFRHITLTMDDLSFIPNTKTLPEITFLLPVYNIANDSFLSVDSVLDLSYPNKHIIIINDGSQDDTLSYLQQKFQFVPIPFSFYKHLLPTKKIKGLYRSTQHPEMFLIDKENGKKRDALNAGLNLCRNPYFITLDADTFVDDKRFLGLIRPLLSYPHVVGVGSSLAVKNNLLIEKGKFSTKDTGHYYLPSVQIIEYLRTFLIRLGWDYFKGTFVISGAFSVFQTDIIRKIGGFLCPMAEDLEIVIRLQYLMKKSKIPYKLFYLPDPIAWTEVPNKIGQLKRQRKKWHLGLLQSLYYHRRIFLNGKCGALGLITFPFLIFAEALEPLMETLAIIIFVQVLFFTSFVALLPWVIFVLGIIVGFSDIAVFAFLIEELSFSRYPLFKTFFQLLILSIVEIFGYRQIILWANLSAFIQFIKDRKQIRLEGKKIVQSMKDFQTKIATKNSP